MSVSFLSLFPLPSCKHRRGPAAPQEWDLSAQGPSPAEFPKLLQESRQLRVLELFEDGFVMTDTLTFRLDRQEGLLQVERRFDPVPSTTEEALVVKAQQSWSPAAQAALLDRLGKATVRQVPRCSPYGAVDGGYGGRFLILTDQAGQEYRFGASDAPCAATDHDCSGSCLSVESMNQLMADLSAVLPIPEKPSTLFACKADSPLPCSQAEMRVHGAWEGSALRADVRRALATGLCQLPALTLEPATEGHWIAYSSTRELLGTLSFDSVNRTVACLSRGP